MLLTFFCLFVCFLRMLLTLVYDGHVRNVLNLPLNVFVSFTVASATELPADLMVVFFLDRWGRRWFSFGTLVISGILSILTTAFAGKCEWQCLVFIEFCSCNFAVNLHWCVQLGQDSMTGYMSHALPYSPYL